MNIDSTAAVTTTPQQPPWKKP